MRGLFRPVLLALVALACSDAATRAIDEGNRLARAGKLDQAAQRFEEAARLDPGPRPRVLLGNVRWAQRRSDEAQKAFQEVLGAVPDQPDALVGAARVELYGGQPAEAVKTVGPVIDRFPARADAHLVRAAGRLAQMQDLDQGLQDVEVALQSASSEAEALYLKGCLLIALKRFGDAQATFDALSARAPKSALSAYGQARLAAAQSRRTDVKLHLLEARTALGEAFDPARVALDPAFDFVREDPDLALPQSDGGTKD